jgi:hypothetical protein
MLVELLGTKGLISQLRPDHILEMHLSIHFFATRRKSLHNSRDVSQMLIT